MQNGMVKWITLEDGKICGKCKFAHFFVPFEGVIEFTFDGHTGYQWQCQGDCDNTLMLPYNDVEEVRVAA